MDPPSARKSGWTKADQASKVSLFPHAMVRTYQSALSRMDTATACSIHESLARVPTVASGLCRKHCYDMQSSEICNIGLGLPDIKMPAMVWQIGIMTSNNTVLSLPARLKCRRTQMSFLGHFRPSIREKIITSSFTAIYFYYYRFSISSFPLFYIFFFISSLIWLRLLLLLLLLWLLWLLLWRREGVIDFDEGMGGNEAYWLQWKYWIMIYWLQSE